MSNQQIYEILLVEDNADDVELILRSLHRFITDNPVKVVKNGAEALDFLFREVKEFDPEHKYQPRLVILDLKLPKIDGLEVLERIKKDPRTFAIPVVVLTSSNERRDIIKCLQIGANSYVVKPVDSDRFSAVLRDVGNYWLNLNEKYL